MYAVRAAYGAARSTRINWRFFSDLAIAAAICTLPLMFVAVVEIAHLALR